MSVLIDGYFVDVVESEQHELSSDVTSHPVEQGADVADNVRAKPRELTFTNAVISDNPIGDAATQRQGISTLPSQDALARLEQIWRDREPVTVVSHLKKYESMVLDKLSITRDAKSFGGLIFTAHFIEVIIVRNKRVTVAIPSAGGQRDLGGKNTKSDPPHDSRSTFSSDTKKIPVASFQVGDPKTLQLHTMPVGRADGSVSRGITAAYVGKDDTGHTPTNRGNIEAYNTQPGPIEQELNTPAVGYPADGFVLAAFSTYLQFKTSDNKPLTYNQATQQYMNGTKPIMKDTGNFTGSQVPNAPGNPVNQNWNRNMKPKS